MNTFIYVFVSEILFFILFITLGEDYLGGTPSKRPESKSPAGQATKGPQYTCQKCRSPDAKRPDFEVRTVFLQFKLLKMFREHVLDSCNKHM
jgi:hypothetical protein